MKSRVRKKKEIRERMFPASYFLDFAAPHHLNSGKQFHQYPGDKDIYHLRQLFVDRVQSNDFYQMLIGTPLLDLNTEMERFREEGTFCGEVGDLVIKVCSDILCVPIMLVTNIAGTPYLPFIPDESVTDQPLFIAFMALGPGHYDATNKVQNEKGNPCSQTST